MLALQITLADPLQRHIDNMALVLEIMFDDALGESGAHCDFANRCLLKALLGDDFRANLCNKLAALLVIDYFGQFTFPTIQASTRNTAITARSNRAPYPFSDRRYLPVPPQCESGCR